jgi:hypothetical protein
MWHFRSEPLAETRGRRYYVDWESRPATFREVIQGWQRDEEFPTLYNQLLADAPFSAFRWETPCVTSETAEQPFEFVLLDSPSLAPHPDPNAFAQYCKEVSDADVVEFPNLGGDAILIVPCQKGDPSVYGHLAAFVRGAPDSQRQSLWRLVGSAMARRSGTKPVWLSTAGAGVSWLHVRLDDRPKYYGFVPYRKIG